MKTCPEMATPPQGVSSEPVDDALSTADLPHVLRASGRLGGGMAPTASFHCEGTAGKTGDYDAVWFRRSGLSMRPPGMPDADWTVAERECDHHIAILRHHLA